MQIVDTQEEFETLLTKLNSQSILIPILTDEQEHPATNPVCVVGVYLPESKEVFGLPFNHSEAKNLPESYLIELGALRTQTDVQALEYVATGSVTEPVDFYPTVIKQLESKFYRNFHVNQALPLVKWMEFLREYGAFLSSVIQNNEKVLTGDKGYSFLIHTAIPVLRKIEQTGLHVDPTIFQQHFGTKSHRFLRHNTVYSQYNLFTSTGRPSCKFGGINFAAINKSDGSRTAFTSRFPSGFMVLLDFESYHLRLIAQLIRYTLPATPIHEYFGKQYFSTDVLTPEQYEESKKKSFHALYSDTESTIPFFKEVNEYKQQLWKEINTNGFILSPQQKQIRLDHIWEPSPAKVFNYLIQWTETERNLTVLEKVLERFKHMQSKVVLYNYDAILVDYRLEDGKDLLLDTIRLLETDANGVTFPVRMYYGKNYGEMKRMNLKS